VPKTVIIVNPKSAGGTAGKRWPETADTIGRIFPFDEAMTTAPGVATVLTRRALAEGAERVIALGGDGTINEVVNGFFDENGQPISTQAQFGIIPFGTGGDFRRTLNIPMDIAGAAKVIAAGQSKAVDVGKLTYTTHKRITASRMFINIASFGVSGVVDRMVNESSKRFGRLSFFIASTKATMSYKNQRVSMVFDDDESNPTIATVSTVAVANGQYFGGAMQVAPNAEVDDGQFDVVCMGDFGIRDLLMSGSRLYKGTHLTMDKVSSRRARIVAAETVEPGSIVEIDLDGENVGTLPARFEMRAGVLQILVPSTERDPALAASAPAHRRTV
jgi:diacylglycerol kinase (ATP)